jgi:hypothetical protein
MINMVNSKIMAIAVALAGVLITLTAIAALSDSTTVPFSGTISTINVEAYTDSACTVPCTSLSVGTVAPGSTVTQTIYIKNAGTLAMNLTMAVSNWSPTNANSYLTLTWNRQNTVLAAGQSTPATLTLVAASNTGSLTTFSCSVTITGTQ